MVIIVSTDVVPFIMALVPLVQRIEEMKKEEQELYELHRRGQVAYEAFEAFSNSLASLEAMMHEAFEAFPPPEIEVDGHASILPTCAVGIDTQAFEAFPVVAMETLAGYIRLDAIVR